MIERPGAKPRRDARKGDLTAATALAQHSQQRRALKVRVSGSTWIRKSSMTRAIRACGRRTSRTSANVAQYGARPCLMRVHVLRLRFYPYVHRQKNDSKDVTFCFFLTPLTASL